MTALAWISVGSIGRAYRDSFASKASVFSAVAYTHAIQMDAPDLTPGNPTAVAPPRSAALSRESRRAALVCGCIVGFAYSANYTNHAPLAPALMREFGFNQTLAGLLTTGIFATHAGMQIPGGHLVDRLGAKRVLLCALAWVALCNVAMAFAGAYWQLLVCKILTGVGTGVCFVGGARYIHAAAGPRLTLPQGLFGGSVQLGSGFVILAVPRLFLLAGWRATFLVSAAMATTAAIIWQSAAPTIEPVAGAFGRWREMLLAPQLWLLGLVQMATFGLSLVVGSWVVVMLTKVLSVPATRAGLIGSLVLLFGIASRPLGGALRRHLAIRPLFAGSLLMIALGCFVFTSQSSSLALALTAVVLIGIGCGLPYASMFSRAGALFPGRAGAAMGLVNMVGIVMILGGAPLVGHLADLSGNFRTSFVVLGGFSLAVCAAVVLVEPEEPIHSEPA
jgi:MFS family permease